MRILAFYNHFYHLMLSFNILKYLLMKGYANTKTSQFTTITFLEKIAFYFSFGFKTVIIN